MEVPRKRQLTVSVFFIALGFACVLSAQDPAEVEAKGTETFDALRRQYAQELYAAQKPVGKNYLKALHRLLDKFAAKGDLESSLAVRKQIETFENFIKEYQEMIDGVLAGKQPDGDLFPALKGKPKSVKGSQSEAKQ